MKKAVFSKEELEWLSAHQGAATGIRYLIEDSQNVNPLDNGLPDDEPNFLAYKAASITIEASQKSILEGPYDDVHFGLIMKYFPANISPGKKEVKKFWQEFSFNCACSFDEDETKAIEQIYMEGLIETLREIDNLGLVDDTNEGVYDFNTETIKKVKVRGVMTRFE